MVAAAFLLVLRKVGLVGERTCRIGLGLFALSVFVAAGVGYLRGLPRRAGAVAICAPNEVSLALTGRGADYDSLNY